MLKIIKCYRLYNLDFVLENQPLQLLKCTDDWTKNLDNKVPTDIIYLDFAKAFDTVSHNMLYFKLQKFGITGDLLKWIIAFLSNRSQRVVINGVFSSFCKVSSGVPQGSVLGPLLFLLFINDLPEFLHDNVSCVLFADDVKIYKDITSVADSEIMQSTLNEIQNWSLMWKLELSPHKCVVLHLGKNNPHFNYVLNGVN